MQVQDMIRLFTRVCVQVQQMMGSSHVYLKVLPYFELPHDVECLHELGVQVVHLHLGEVGGWGCDVWGWGDAVVGFMIRVSGLE